jgi:ribosomal protein S27AE
MDERAPWEDSRQVDRMACLRCGARMRDDGEVEIRTGGSGAAGHFFLGNLADMGESKLRLDRLYCGHCGYVEFRRPPT